LESKSRKGSAQLKLEFAETSGLVDTKQLGSHSGKGGFFVRERNKERSLQMPDKEIKFDVVREKVCKNSVRVQAMNEPPEFRTFYMKDGVRVECPSQWYLKNEIMAALGNPAEFELILRTKQ